MTFQRIVDSGKKERVRGWSTNTFQVITRTPRKTVGGTSTQKGREINMFLSDIAPVKKTRLRSNEVCVFRLVFLPYEYHITATGQQDCALF